MRSRPKENVKTKFYGRKVKGLLRTLKNLAIEEQLKAMKLKNNNLKLQI